jgi:hypothetical protein
MQCGKSEHPLKIGLDLKRNLLLLPLNGLIFCERESGVIIKNTGMSCSLAL